LSSVGAKSSTCIQRTFAVKMAVTVSSITHVSATGSTFNSRRTFQTETHQTHVRTQMEKRNSFITILMVNWHYCCQPKMKQMMLLWWKMSQPIHKTVEPDIPRWRHETKKYHLPTRRSSLQNSKLSKERFSFQTPQSTMKRSAHQHQQPEHRTVPSVNRSTLSSNTFDFVF
jgi:hypothetical protein